MKNNKRVVYAILSAAIFAACSMQFSGTVKAEEKSEQKDANTTISENISISGTDVSGMTKEEAEKVVSKYVKQYDGVEFDLTVDDKSITADRKDIGLCAKNSDVVDRALSYGTEGNLIYRYKAQADMKNGKGKDFEISLTADTPTVESFLQQHKDELVVEAVDNTVKLVDGEFEYVEGKAGEALLVGKSAVAIADYISTDWNGKNASITLLTEKDTPRGTKEELSTIKDVLGSFDTNFGTAVDGRTKNIAVASGKLDGMVVYPGEVVSVAQTIGPTTQENGYFLAGSYENGTTVETYGGGVCQVSSTLYNAVILSELEIVTRSAHSMIVGYVEPSKDAAIADGAKDLQFKNNQKTPIYIESHVGGGNLYFSIYGQETRPANRKVEFISEVTSQTEPTKEYVAVGDQPIGYVETTTKPHVGYTARLWKVVYEDGAEVSRKVFNNSKYNPSKEVISVGIATANPQAQAEVVAAIATQNPDIIMATVGIWNEVAPATSVVVAPPTQVPATPATPTTPTTPPAAEQKPTENKPSNDSNTSEGNSNNTDSGQSNTQSNMHSNGAETN